MALTQWHSAEELRPGMTAETLTSRDMGCSVEKSRNRMIRGEAQDGTGDSIAINSSSVVSINSGQLKKCRPGGGQKWF